MLKNKYTPLFIVASIATIGLFLMLGYAASKSNINIASSVLSKADSLALIKKQADSLKLATNNSYNGFNDAVAAKEIVAEVPNTPEYTGVQNVHDIKKEVDVILETPKTAAQINTVIDRKNLMDETIDALKIPKEKDPEVRKRKKTKLIALNTTYTNTKLKQQDLASDNSNPTNDNNTQVVTENNTAVATTPVPAPNVSVNSSSNTSVATNAAPVQSLPTAIDALGANTKADAIRNRNGIVIVKGGKVKNVKFNLLNGSNNPTTIADDIKTVAGDFDFIADKDIVNTSLYVIITLPNGSVLRNSDWDVSAFKDDEGNRKIASKVFKVDYKKGQQVPINFNIAANALKPGNYTFEVYHNSLIVHKFTRTLQ